MKRLGTTSVLVMVAVATLVIFGGVGGVSYQVRADATHQAEQDATATAASNNATATASAVAMSATATAEAVSMSATASARADLVASVPTTTTTPATDSTLVRQWGDGTDFDFWNMIAPWTTGGTSASRAFLRLSGQDTDTSRYLLAPSKALSQSYAVEVTIQLELAEQDGCLELDDPETSFGIVVQSDTPGIPFRVGVDCSGFAGLSRSDDFCCDSTRVNEVPVMLDTFEHVYRVEYRANSIRFFIDDILIFEEFTSRESDYGDSLGVWGDGVNLRVTAFRIYSL